MAKSTEKRAQISATIPASLKEALEEYRWGVRMNLSELVEVALTEFARDKDIVIQDVEFTDEDESTGEVHVEGFDEDSTPESE